MNWLRQWQPAPMAALLMAWVVGSGALLTLYFLAQARSLEREYTEMGFRLGGTESHIQVNWGEMWPQLAAIYLMIVVLPPALLWLFWRRSRRAS